MAQNANTPAPLNAEARAGLEITSQRLIVGMEVHVELATRSKLFTPAPNVAHESFDGSPPNTLTDSLVLALPGSLPVLNDHAVELSMLVGMAIGCRIPDRCVWDRKSYFYPDLPKAYQISQYDQPLCAEGVFRVWPMDDDGWLDVDAQPFEIRMTRAHLEEDAGKLSHEAPAGMGGSVGTLIDLNRAGTPLLEIVTEPDFQSASQAVAFARQLRDVCRFLGATRGIMQRGHMRFEPNINLELTLGGEHAGTTVRTPVVEVKNLNSFRALVGSIEYEQKSQAERWRQDGREMGPGAKTTRGWDDQKLVTIVQREKEDAHDYRYFPDPDLPPLDIDDARRDRVRSMLVECPAPRALRYHRDLGLAPRDAQQIASERAMSDLFEGAMGASGLAETEAAKLTANLLLQSGAKIANERGVGVGDLDVPADAFGTIVAMRADGSVSSNGAGELLEALVGDPSADVRSLAESRGLLVVRDEGALAAWCQEVIDANGPIVEQIRGGKQQAAGRLIGEVMKKSGGSADAKTVRAMLLEMIGA